MSGRKRKSASGCDSSASKTAAAKKGPEPKKTRRGHGSREMTAFVRTYKGLDDYHIPLFKAVAALTSAQRVLYPGCHRHISASLAFPDIVYVDNYKKVQDCFTDPVVLEFVEKNKSYSGDSKIKFQCKNFESDFGEKVNSFDLMISLNAGIVTKPCAKYVKRGGYMLVGDGHFDARMAFVNKNYRLIGVYDSETETFDQSEAGLKGHFTTKDGKKMTEAMVKESIEKPKARRSFKLQKEALFYIFKKET